MKEKEMNREESLQAQERRDRMMSFASETLEDNCPDALADLKAQRRWLVWRKELKNGRVTKKPYAVNGGATGTNLYYSHTWGTYEEAKEAAEKFTCEGVGFVIPQDVFFLDIDHQSLKSPFVQEMLQRLPSYAELSQSGNGIHIYGYVDTARLPLVVGKNGENKLDPRYYQKNDRLDLEIYFGTATNRFAVCTEHAVQKFPLRDCTDAILEIMELYMRRGEKLQAAGYKLQESELQESELQEDYDLPEDSPERWEKTKAVLSEEDFELLRKAMSRHAGKRLKRLFFEGCFEEKKSHSEADFELCLLLAKIYGCRKETIDAVFRCSALYRTDKWEREDYSERTIERALAELQPKMDSVLPGRPKFITERKGVESVNANRLAQYFCERNQVKLVQADATGPVQVYLYEGGRWLLKSDTQLKGMLKKIIESYDEGLVKERLLSEVCCLLRDETETVPPSRLDEDETIINFQNGILKMGPDGSLTLLPHSPELLSTLQLPLNWNPDARETPVFDAFLKRLCDGDEEAENLILEFLGVCFSNIPGYRMKKALFLYGPGDTGKSQLRSLAERILGEENCCPVGLQELEGRFGVSMLYGKRLAGSADLGFLTVEELKSFKSLTGGDSVVCEFKHMPAFRYSFKGVLWFCMNQLTRFGGDNGSWVYERMMILECPNVIPKAEQDKRLLEKMLAEREGIVLKAVLALQGVIADCYRFHEPKRMKLERERYTAVNNSVVGFKEECICNRSETPDISEEISWQSLYRDYYVPYCRDNHRGYAKSCNDFKAELAANYNCEPADMVVHTRRGNILRDITVTAEARQTYSGYRLI